MVLLVRVVYTVRVAAAAVTLAPTMFLVQQAHKALL